MKNTKKDIEDKKSKELFETIVDLSEEKGYLKGMRDEVMELMRFVGKYIDEKNCSCQEISNEELFDYVELRIKIWNERIEMASEEVQKEAKKYKIDEKVS